MVWLMAVDRECIGCNPFKPFATKSQKELLQQLIASLQRIALFNEILGALNLIS